MSHNDLRLIIGSDSPIGGVVTAEEYSKHSLGILHRLVEFEASDIEKVLSAVVNGEDAEVHGISVSDISDVVSEYRLKRNNFFKRGVKTFDSVGRKFMRFYKPELRYVIESVDRETGLPLPRRVIPYEEIAHDLDVLPEDLVAQAHAPISPEGIPGKVTGSFVVLKPEFNSSGIEEMIYRCKSPESLTNKLANIHFRVGLPGQRDYNADLIKDDQAFILIINDKQYKIPLINNGASRRVAAEFHNLNRRMTASIIRNIQSVLSNHFPPVYYDSEDGKLHMIIDDEEMEVEGNETHFIKPRKDAPVWRHIEKNALKERNWEGDQALLLNRGLYEVQIQTRTNYDDGKKDHAAYKSRQKAGLSDEELLERDRYQQKSHHLLFYLGAKNLSSEQIDRIPGLRKQLESVEEIYRKVA